MTQHRPHEMCSQVSSWLGSERAGLGPWDRLLSRLGQAPFPGPGCPPSPPALSSPWSSFVLKIEGPALGAEGKSSSPVSVAFHSLQGHDTRNMSSFFKVIQNRISHKLFVLSNLPSSPTVLRTTLGQPLLRRASRGPGVVPRKEGAAKGCLVPRLLAQICVLASQTFRNAQNRWGSPTPQGRPGLPCARAESAVTNLGARGRHGGHAQREAP